jgi:hypothetical protein
MQTSSSAHFCTLSSKTPDRALNAERVRAPETSVGETIELAQKLSETPTE